MFLNIDQHHTTSVALKDNYGYCLTYRELCEEILKMQPFIKSRSIVFCLCQNTIGAVTGYLSFIEFDSVPLMLSSSIDPVLLNTLIQEYEPSFLWVPTVQKNNFPYKTTYESNGYSLLQTKNQIYSINENLELLMTTSGSTGSPKLVRYKKGNLESNAKNVAKAFQWSSKENAIADLGMQYTMGLNVINTHLYVGATVLLTTDNLMSADFWDYIKKEKATNFTGVPFSYDILFRLRILEMDLPYLTTLAEGGGKLTDKRFKELALYAKENNKRFIATFGTTETSARLSMLPSELAYTKCGSIGKAIPEGEIYLIDSEGKIIESQIAEGEMCYKGPNVTMGYALSKNDLKKGDEWNGTFRTGDLARRDKDGYYYVTGRLSRFLKLLSYRVSLDQCEKLIKETFETDCACSGTDKYMEIYVTNALIVKDVQNFICKKTGLFKSLFKIYHIDKVPRSDTGKILYKKLKKNN